MDRSSVPSGVHDIPFSNYLAIKAWGSGSLKAMRRGPPRRVIFERDGGRADTDATILGSAVHCLLLTPDLFSKQYAIKPDGMSFASKEGKAWRDDPVRAGLTLLSHDVGLAIDDIVEALLANKAVAASLKRAEHREVSLVWDCSTTGERCKARPDWIAGKFIYDLKVSRHASGSALGYRSFIEGWMHQSAHYRTGAIELGQHVTGGRLVVVEPTPPHFVYTLEIKRDALDLLEIENIQTLRMLRDCRVANVWPGPSEDWVKIEPPASAGLDAMNDVNLGELKDDEEAEQAEEQT